MPVTLHQLLKTMVERGGSDLHVTTNSPPQIRIDGKLVPLDMPPLTAPETKQLAYSVLTDAQKHRFEEELELFFEAMLLRVGQDRVGQLLGLGRRQRRHVERHELAVDPDLRRGVGRNVKIGTSALDHGLEKLMQGDGHLFSVRRFGAEALWRFGFVYQAPKRLCAQSASSLQHSLSHHFFDRGDSILDFNQTAPAQTDHADLRRFFLDVDGRAAGEDQLADVVVDGHHFDQSDAAFVAGVVALLTAAALVHRERPDLVLLEADVQQRLGLDVYRFLALRADAARETLRGDELHRGRHEERLDAHVHQAVDGRRRVVRVQRREHEMAGERGLDGDLGGLEVADLADQDDVRILPQEGAERGGEVQADRFLHLHLVDTGQIELDRIFRGHDVHFRRV